MHNNNLILAIFFQVHCKNNFLSKTNTERRQDEIAGFSLMAYYQATSIQKLKPKNTLNVESIRNSCPNNGGMMQRWMDHFIV